MMAEIESGDRAELERLQAENADLRTRNSELEARRGPSEERRPGRWRWPTAIVLLVIGGLLLALAVPAIWAANTVLNTDRYTETVAPLATDPAIRDSVAVTAVDRLFAQVPVESEVRSALPPKAAFLAPQITSGLHDFSVTAAETALATKQFQTLWTEANRRAHQRIVPLLLTGQGPRGALNIQNGTVTIDISSIVGQVKQALVSRGVTIVNSVPDTVAGGSVTLLQSAQLGQVQTVLRTLQTLSIALPIVAVLVLAAAVFAAPDRRRALLWLGATAILAMLAIGVALALLRNAYVAAPPVGILSGSAAVSFFDTMVRFLRNAIRTVAAVGLVLLIGAALAGPSTAAVRIRQAVGGGLSALGLDFGRPSLWTERHRTALDAIIVIIAGIVLFSTNAPTPGLVIGLAIAVLVAFLLVELVARAHPPAGPTYRGQPSM